MTNEPVELSTLLNARKQLIAEITQQMPEHHKRFLYSFYKRTPKWGLLGIVEARHLPAVRWRETNLDKSGAGTREALLEKLKRVLGS